MRIPGIHGGVLVTFEDPVEGLSIPVDQVSAFDVYSFRRLRWLAIDEDACSPGMRYAVNAWPPLLRKLARRG